MQPTLITPGERRATIIEFEREIEALRRAECWQKRFDYDNDQLWHREHLEHLIASMRERIYELSR